jgi:heme exporter protein A
MPEAKPLFINSLLTLKEAACLRGGRTLFQNLSLEILPGALLHLAGPNGTGKTSLLRVMASALPLSEGYVIFNAGKVAFMPANDQSLKVLETAEENLLFWMKASKTKADITTVLKKMKMEHLRDKPVRYFSAGQKRRLSLVRVFLSEAPLWLLDEPFNGLDAESLPLVMAEISAQRQKGGAVVIAGHQEVPGAQVIRLGGAA